MQLPLVPGGKGVRTLTHTALLTSESYWCYPEGGEMKMVIVAGRDTEEGGESHQDKNKKDELEGRRKPRGNRLGVAGVQCQQMFKIGWAEGAP